MKLLIVDDSLVIRNKINRALLTEFSQVSRAENGLIAIEHVKRDRPDIVTMDLTKPTMGGVSCVKELINIYPTMRILVVSALADKKSAISALAAGANGFVCKPFSSSELTYAIYKVLNMDYLNEKST